MSKSNQSLAIVPVQQQALFNYDVLNAANRDIVVEATERIKACSRIAVRTAIELGGHLARVKDMLTPGQYEQWLDAEFQWKTSSALNFIRVWQQYGTVKYDLEKIATTALYLLSAPSTPDAARDEVQKLVEKGERVTVVKAKAIIEKAKEEVAPTFPEFQPEQPVTMPVEVPELPIESHVVANELVAPAAVIVERMQSVFDESHIKLKVVLRPSNGQSERAAVVSLCANDEVLRTEETTVPTANKPFEFLMPTIAHLLGKVMLDLTEKLKSEVDDHAHIGGTPTRTERTQAELDEWAKHNSVMKIAEQSHGVQRVYIDGNPYVVTGHMSAKNGVEKVWASSVLPIANYGAERAMTYQEATRRNSEKKPLKALSYVGIKVNCGSAKKPDYWVIVNDKLEFTVAKPDESKPTAKLCKRCNHEDWHHIGTTDPSENDDESCGKIGCKCERFVEAVCACGHPQTEHGNGEHQEWTGCGEHECECSEFEPFVENPSAATPLKFKQTGTFKALSAAHQWLKTNGYSYADGCARSGHKAGILKGDYGIAKWRNLTKAERLQLHGYIHGDMREGPVFVTIYQKGDRRIV